MLAYLERLEQAREQGHNILIQRAEAIIFQKTTGQLAPDYFNNSGFESAVKNLKASAEDLDNLAHLWRPFITEEDHVKDLEHFGEMCFCHDAQRAVKTWTNESWQAEVIEPMKEYHKNIIDRVKALRCRLLRAAPKGNPGRKAKYPPDLVDFVRTLRAQNPQPDWKVVYAEVRQKFPNVEPPKCKSFTRYMEKLMAGG